MIKIVKNKIMLGIILLVGLLTLVACSGTSNQTAHIGSPAPIFQLKDLNGKSISISDYRGKVLLINFWDTTCPPCVSEMPYLQALYQDEYSSSNNIILLTVDLGESTGTVNNFMHSNNYTFPVLMDSQGVVAAKYGVLYTPTSIIIDKNGILRTSIIGAFKDKAAIEQAISPFTSK